VASFRAFRIHQEGGKIAARVETIGLDDLAAGEVVVKVRYSTINYKDALAATGAGKILRKYPLVGGIDLAGEVVSSQHADFKPGQKVLVNGCGLSETHDGGYAEYARVAAEWVVPIPAGLDEFQCMAIGTAGYTAALAIHRMEQNGSQPPSEKHGGEHSGEIVVTGATGGVGSLAIDMLAGRGYQVVAVTGKKSSADYLERLGAARVLLRDEINLGSRPLEEAQWAGAIDNLGGDVLAWLTRTTKFWGNIASIGLAASPELKTTVVPFILRGVNLLGINSVYTPRPLRLAVWQRLATDLKPRHLDTIVTRIVGLDELPQAFEPYVKGAVIGRAVVKIG
jgi:acrylyl-CoA reductase (NADPH)